MQKAKGANLYKKNEIFLPNGNVTQNVNPGLDTLELIIN